MENRFTDHYRVPSYELDPDRRLRISSILKLMQETAGRHLDGDGQTYEAMRKNGIVFLLMHIALRITRLPGYDEHLAISTWFVETRGAHFVREMCFNDAQGVTVIQAQTDWVIVDPDTHRVLRPNRVPFEMPRQAGSAAGIQVQKIIPPANTTQIGSREIRFSDIDCNQHLNNAIYADILMDSLPAGTRGQDIHEIQLAFLGEAKQGETIAVSGAKTGEGVYYLHGAAPTHKCFDASVKMFKETLAFEENPDYTINS